jgi:hypothetical protein
VSSFASFRNALEQNLIGVARRAGAGPPRLLHRIPGQGHVASVFYRRESTGAGIYDVAGNLIRGDQAARYDLSGHRPKSSSSMKYSRNLGFLVSYSQLRPGRYIVDTGTSKTAHFVSSEIEVGF